MRNCGTWVGIGLGANLDDRVGRLRLALGKLRETLDDLRVSSVYETAPMHIENQPDYLNACCVGRTRLAPRRLLSVLKGIERQLGRRADGRRYGARVVDLDLLLYGELVLEEEELVVPHPRLRERAFVLVPLAELAADWMVPASGGAPESTVGRLVSTIDSTSVRLTNLTIDRA